MQIKVTKTTAPKAKPDYNNLGFGKYFTDHMFVMNYTEGKGWYDPRIVPYAPIELEPSAMVFHYAQEVFEGLKAYYTKEGKVLLFRPDQNMARLNASNDRMGIPQIDEAFGVEAIKELVKIDADWIPKDSGQSLYIRPFIIATDASLGVHAAKNYLFIVILSPVGSYYAGGMNPIKIYVEDEYVRAVRGGTGAAKTGGNYAASIKAQVIAEKQGYTQVLWLDGVERKYIEEVGAMNVFFKVDGKVLTPALRGSVLPGITRKSCVELMKTWGLEVEERPISIEELSEAAKEGRLEEAFGTGTAAVISPIGELLYMGEKTIINEGKIGPTAQKLYDVLTGIQWGDGEDPFGWTTEVSL